jgi:hypothetical protein
MKQFKFKFPELFNLPNAEYMAKETEKGYGMQTAPKEWIGFPKSVVEGCGAFEYVGEFEPKKKRPRIKAKKI